MSDQKKALLSEAQIRQFMKLAHLEPLTNGFIRPLTNAFVNESTPTDPQELEELRTGRTGRLGPSDGTANPGRGRGQGEAASGAIFEEEDVDELEGDIEHDLGDDSLEGDEEAVGDELEIDAELGDEAAGAQVVNVDEFLSALEVALENVLGDEVEIDSDEVEDVGVEAEPEFAPEGDDVVEDELELQEGDEEELEEARLEQPGADIRQSAPKRGAEATLRRTGKRKGKKDAYVEESTEADEDLVEQITKRVAARILKAALNKK